MWLSIEETNFDAVARILLWSWVPRLLTRSFPSSSGHVPRIKEKALGGSALLDIGCYTLQFAQWILREKHERLEVKGELFDTGQVSNLILPPNDFANSVINWLL